MSDITGISSALQMIQSNFRTEMGVKVIKQAAQADKALADMLAENAKTGAELSKGQAKGISIYV